MLSAVIDEQKSVNIGQLEKAFQRSRDKIERAEACIAEPQQQLSNVTAS